MASVNCLADHPHAADKTACWDRLKSPGLFQSLMLEMCLTLIQTHFIVTSASEFGWCPCSRQPPPVASDWVTDVAAAVLGKPPFFIHSLYSIDPFSHVTWHQLRFPSSVKQTTHKVTTNWNRCATCVFTLAHVRVDHLCLKFEMCFACVATLFDNKLTY